MSANDRSNYWAFIVYAESAPDNWIQLLEDLKVPAAISPQHCDDVWSESDEKKDSNHKAGTLKKPHWHVVLYYSSLKSCSQVIGDVSPLGVSYVERVRNIKTYNRYLCHMDNPDKAQYDTADIRLLNGAMCDLTPEMTRELMRQMRDEILHFIDEKCITEYNELVYMCLNSHYEWLDYVETHTIFLQGVLGSKRHSCYVSDEESSG
jgi:hypothetical protein